MAPPGRFLPDCQRLGDRRCALSLSVEIQRERINDSVAKRRAAGTDLGGRRQQFTRSQILNARRLVDGGEPAVHVAKDLGTSRAILFQRIHDLAPSTEKCDVD